MTCDNDSTHIEYHVAEVTSKTISASCEQAGTTIYTATVTLFDGSTKYTDEKQVEDEPARGHSWSSWTTKTAATVFDKEQQVRTCSTCKAAETRKYGTKLNPTITLPAKNLKMQVKQKTTAFKVTGMANGDSVKSVTSSNQKVLKVTNVKPSGTFKLAAQKKGKATLTIELASGLTKKVKITVQKKAVKTTKISGLSKKVTLKKGKKTTLSPVITPITSQDKVTYKSSNKKAATVSAKGVVKAKKAGKAKITVKSGSKKFVVNVVVE